MQKLRPTHRVQRENEMIRKRDKESHYQQTWNDTEQYYKFWNKSNSKFNDWTSPRYYSDNNQLVSQIRLKRDKEELLVKRREKLRKLLDEDEKTYSIELTIEKQKNYTNPTPRRLDSIPTELLKEVNIGLKQKEEARQRHQAEIKLYQRWRNDNPAVRSYERNSACRNLKLSWLDQQIEKRMREEKEEEDRKAYIAQQSERIKKHKQQEIEQKAQFEVKQRELKEELDAQVAELKRKQEMAASLKDGEIVELERKLKLYDLEDMQKAEEKLRAEQECTLFNQRQCKLKLKRKMQDVQRNLKSEQAFIAKLQQMALEECMEDAAKRQAIKDELVEYSKLLKAQQELEKVRQKQIDFIFDSEAKAVYERQAEQWRKEEAARQKLVSEVMCTLKQQIELRINANKQRQIAVRDERTAMLENVERLAAELQEMKVLEASRKVERKKEKEEDIKFKAMCKKEKENVELKEFRLELEHLRKEEDRITNEIMSIQNRHSPVVRPSTSRVLY